MYYFAYGSNMNLEHMRKLCGWNFNVLGSAILPDYGLVIDNRGYINITPKTGEKVWGVLYSVNQKVIDILDEFEGVPYVFKRQEVEVTDEEDAQVKAWVYIETNTEFGGDFVREEFLKRVLIGATENHLPQEWIDYLKSFGGK